MLESLDILIAFAVIFLTVSLIITVVVQMISAALNLRGLNLARGLTETLHTISPDTTPEGKLKAKALTSDILTGSMVSDSSIVRLTRFFPRWLRNLWRHATAIRADEAFDAIHRIATGKKKTTDEFQTNARDLLVALGMGPEKLDILKAQQGQVTSALEGFDAALGALPPGTATDIMTEARAALLSVAAEAQTQVQAATAEFAGGVEAAYRKFQYWFDLGQDRAQEWFATQTRLWTVLAAVFFAFFWQLDTIEIFRLVSTNATLRNQLVAQARVAQEQAAKLLVDSPTVIQAAMKEWAAQQKDDATKKAIAGVTIEAHMTRGQVREAVVNALKARSQPADSAALPEIVGTFDEAVDEAATKRLKEGQTELIRLGASLDKTGFSLFPPGGSRWKPVPKDASTSGMFSWINGIPGFAPHYRSHWLGMFCSAALLSLGAPFWFNTLKGLTNLRSAVAKNIDEEAKTEKKAPSAKPPPTVTR